MMGQRPFEQNEAENVEGAEAFYRRAFRPGSSFRAPPFRTVCGKDGRTKARRPALEFGLVDVPGVEVHGIIGFGFVFF